MPNARLMTLALIVVFGVALAAVAQNPQTRGLGQAAKAKTPGAGRPSRKPLRPRPKQKGWRHPHRNARPRNPVTGETHLLAPSSWTKQASFRSMTVPPVFAASSSGRRNWTEWSRLLPT